MQLGEVVQAELEGTLHRDQAFLGGDLVGQRAQQRRLARVGGPGHHDVLAGGHRRGQERAHVGGDRAVADQVGEEDLAHPGAPDGDRGPQRHVHHRGQPGSVGQPQVELGVGGVERAAGQPRVGGQDLDQLDQFLVALGDRLAEDLAAVGVADEDPVVAVDVDVLDVLVFQQRLEPAHAEQRCVDRLGEVLFLLRVQRRAADQDLAPGVLLQHLGDERPGELTLVLPGHRRHPGRGVQAPLLGQPVAYVAAQALDKSMIHRRHPPPDRREPMEPANP